MVQKEFQDSAESVGGEKGEKEIEEKRKRMRREKRGQGEQNYFSGSISRDMLLG